MRGEVLHYDQEQGFGFITGSDGTRYSFGREDLRRDTVVGRGTPVEFQPNGGQAKSVFPIRAQAGAQPASPQQTATPAHFGRNAMSAPGGMPAPSLGLWGYFTRCLSTDYVNFRDRARRKEYWGFILFWTLSVIILSLAVISSIMSKLWFQFVSMLLEFKLNEQKQQTRIFLRYDCSYNIVLIIDEGKSSVVELLFPKNPWKYTDF